MYGCDEGSSRCCKDGSNSGVAQTRVSRLIGRLSPPATINKSNKKNVQTPSFPYSSLEPTPRVQQRTQGQNRKELHKKTCKGRAKEEIAVTVKREWE